MSTKRLEIISKDKAAALGKLQDQLKAAQTQVGKANSCIFQHGVSADTQNAVELAINMLGLAYRLVGKERVAAE